MNPHRPLHRGNGRTAFLNRADCRGFVQVSKLRSLTHSWLGRCKFDGVTGAESTHECLSHAITGELVQLNYQIDRSKDGSDRGVKKLLLISLNVAEQ